VLGYPHIAELALAGGLADAVRSIEARSLAGFFAQSGPLAADLAEYFAGFALILSYLYDPDGIFLANVARCSKAQFIAGPHRPDDKASMHATEVFLKPLERLAIFGADPVPRLAPHATRSTQHVLALHPGSGSEKKNWPEARWAELLARLVAETPFRILLIGGEAEGGFLPRLSQTIPAVRRDICFARPLAEVAHRLSACAAFVGHDSGITHLAAALGVPTLALWGPTNKTVWAPRGEHVRLLGTPRALAALPVADVFDQLQLLIAAWR
jgi:hypothetical protein